MHRGALDWHNARLNYSSSTEIKRVIIHRNSIAFGKLNPEQLFMILTVRLFGLQLLGDPGVLVYVEIHSDTKSFCMVRRHIEIFKVNAKQILVSLIFHH